MSELLTYDSQEVEYFRDKNIFKLKINEPFHSAGNQYKWVERLGKEGIGINKKLIDLADKLDSTLLIYLGTTKEYFMIESWIIKDFCEKYNSIYNKLINKQIITLYVYPTNNLNRLPIVKDLEIQQTI